MFEEASRHKSLYEKLELNVRRHFGRVQDYSGYASVLPQEKSHPAKCELYIELEEDLRGGSATSKVIDNLTLANSVHLEV